MLTEESRRNIVITQEGVTLEQVGRLGAETAADVCRAQIDGSINALIRIDGREAAAEYAFAMSDRVAGGLREPTDYRLTPEEDEPEDEAAPQPTWKFKAGWWGMGVGHGLILAWLISVWRGG